MSQLNIFNKLTITGADSEGDAEISMSGDKTQAYINEADAFQIVDHLVSVYGIGSIASQSTVALSRMSQAIDAELCRRTHTDLKKVIAYSTGPQKLSDLDTGPPDKLMPLDLVRNWRASYPELWSAGNRERIAYLRDRTSELLNRGENLGMFESVEEKMMATKLAATGMDADRILSAIRNLKAASKATNSSFLELGQALEKFLLRGKDPECFFADEVTQFSKEQFEAVKLRIKERTDPVTGISSTDSAPLMDCAEALISITKDWFGELSEISQRRLTECVKIRRSNGPWTGPGFNKWRAGKKNLAAYLRAKCQAPFSAGDNLDRLITLLLMSAAAPLEGTEIYEIATLSYIYAG